jgi:predicted RNase H-like nuclease (RuvC/YqgF family)
MEDTLGNYNQEDDIRGMDAHMGIEGTNSNGHGEGKDENMNMVEIIKNFQKDVQSHKDNNERLMTTNEKQEDFNMNLMQSLNIIEKKLDKESGSRKSVSHRSPNEKRRTRSVRRHHHHSPRYSNKREHNKSSPSPVRKHKRSRVDEL